VAEHHPQSHEARLIAARRFIEAERESFDRAVRQFHDGDTRAHIAHVLTIWAAVHDGGSYADQCRIMAEEVLKLRLPDGVPVAAKTSDGGSNS
jgi:hypothetical protein